MQVNSKDIGVNDIHQSYIEPAAAGSDCDAGSQVHLSCSRGMSKAESFPTIITVSWCLDERPMVTYCEGVTEISC